MRIRDPLERMERELKKALNKPKKDREWVMIIDTLKCVGCESCTISCKAENKTPPGVSYNVVIKKEVGRYPKVSYEFIPRPCMQCRKPPCTKVCPVRATWKDVDGIVVIDYEKCIGCRYCITACPYGARYFDFAEYYTEDTPQLQPYETIESYEYDRAWLRKRRLFLNPSPMENARKCHFCLHRIERGMLPACVTTCLGRARFFGDLKDPESLVSELIAQYRPFRLREELGTDPSVYYLK